MLRLFRWTLVNWECYTRSFGSFSASLHELQIVEPTSDTTALLLLVTSFSDIGRIVIVNPSILSTDTSRIFLPTNLRLRWKVVQLLSFGRRCITFLQKFAEFPGALSWEELTLGFASDVYRLNVFSRLLSSCSATLRVLRIVLAHPGRFSIRLRPRLDFNRPICQTTIWRRTSFQVTSPSHPYRDSARSSFQPHRPLSTHYSMEDNFRWTKGQSGCTQI